MPGSMRIALLAGCLAMAGCGSDVPTSETAAASRANADARAEAQGPYVANPGVKMCIWETASEEERKALDAGGTSAEATVAEILERKEARQCMRDNKVVIYL